MKLPIVGVAILGLIYAVGARAADMPPLAHELGCVNCHAIDTKVFGPAWMDVSRKYKGQTTYKYSAHGSGTAEARDFSLVEGLVLKVSKGGSGNWGSQPMPSNDPIGAKKNEIRSLVEFILALAK